MGRIIYLHRNYLCLFLLGVAVGFFMSPVLFHLSSTVGVTNCGLNWKAAEAYIRPVRINEINERIEDDTNGVLMRPVAFRNSRLHTDASPVAERLVRDVRILCLVMTYPENHQTRAIHVNATWGRRCSKLLFVTRESDPTIPTLVVDVDDGREYLGQKTRAAFSEAFARYAQDYDWFVKADDDTYVIMENLRYFLSQQDTNAPVYFGQNFSPFVKQGYPSGGAAYVVSREALGRFAKTSGESCNFTLGSEDADFGLCMESLGVSFGDSLDSLGRTRFHCFSPEGHVNGYYPDWFYAYDKFKGKKQGIENMSDYAITFHYVEPSLMYTLEYFVYHLRPYGITKSLQDLNTNVTAV